MCTGKSGFTCKCKKSVHTCEKAGAMRVFDKGNAHSDRWQYAAERDAALFSFFDKIRSFAANPCRYSMLIAGL